MSPGRRVILLPGHRVTDPIRSALKDQGHIGAAAIGPVLGLHAQQRRPLAGPLGRQQLEGALEQIGGEGGLHGVEVDLGEPAQGTYLAVEVAAGGVDALGGGLGLERFVVAAKLAQGGGAQLQQARVVAQGAR